MQPYKIFLTLASITGWIGIIDLILAIGFAANSSLLQTNDSICSFIFVSNFLAPTFIGMSIIFLIIGLIIKYKKGK
ncbi:MAG: hypothetical protein U0M23_08475 [Acutalibacteraceae bacterium]|nr:hypothetical protein [Acutalibacteraceae bacterium]